MFVTLPTVPLTDSPVAQEQITGNVRSFDMGWCTMLSRSGLEQEFRFSLGW